MLVRDMKKLRVMPANDGDFHDLRTLAEAAELRLQETACQSPGSVSRDSALMHELQVHQLELELQNEALRKALFALELARDRYADLFDFAPIAYLTISRELRIIDANFAAAAELGLSRSELKNQLIGRFIAAVDLDRWHRKANEVWRALGTRREEFEMLLRNAADVKFPAQLHCMATELAPGQPIMRIALINDSVRSAEAAELERLANHDVLTQLPNRRLFRDRLKHAVAAGRRSGMYGAVLFLDLDNFKRLNDALGHDAGDELLIDVAHRLRNSLREGDTVARIGGDEFVMILEGLGIMESTAVALAKQIANKLNSIIAHRIKLGDDDFICTTSIGVRLFGPGDSSDKLLKQADTALYQAKAAGRNQVCLFDPSS